MAGILETFGILFESDADNVKKGAEEAESAAEDLEGKLGDIDDTTTELGDSFLDMIGSAKGAIAGLLSAGAIAGGLINAAQMTDEIGKFSETLGLNISEVSAWSEAVVRSGGDASGFRGSIKSLTDGLTDFTLTGGGPAADVFARLGINAVDSSGKVKSAFEILPELADTFKDLSKAEAVGFGQKLGLDQGTILLLQQGKAAVDDLVGRQKELGVATQKDYEIAAKFNDIWADTKQVFNSVFIASGSSILPMFTSILRGAQDVAFFLAENSDLVTGFFIGAAGAVTYFFLPAMLSAAAATLATIAPFVLIGAAIAAVGTAFALLYEDVQAFLSGNDSFIGSISKDYPIVGEFVKQLASNIGTAFDALKWIGQFLLDLFTQPMVALESLGDLASAVGDKIFGAFEGVKDFFGFGDEDIDANITQANKVFSDINANPLNGQTSNSIVNANKSLSKQTTVSVGEVNVSTQATDAEGVAAGVSKALNEQMQSAVNDYDNGVAY